MWSFIGDFGGLARWHPKVQACRVEGSGLGALRIVTLDGWSATERLTAFEPERFLPTNGRERPRFAYIPFGAGPRICIGMQMALAESVILLAALAQRYDLDLAPGHAVRLRHQITLRPEEGLRMVLRRR